MSYENTTTTATTTAHQRKDANSKTAEAGLGLGTLVGRDSVSTEESDDAALARLGYKSEMMREFGNLSTFR